MGEHLRIIMLICRGTRADSGFSPPFHGRSILNDNGDVQQKYHSFPSLGIVAGVKLLCVVFLLQTLLRIINGH